MAWPCCSGVPWHKESCPLYGRAMGGIGPFTQEPCSELAAAPARHALHLPVAPQTSANSRRTFHNDSDFWQQQLDRATERQARFSNQTHAPLAPKKTIAWAGGKISSNKAEAIEAFIARKRLEGSMDSEQEKVVRASLKRQSKAVVQESDGRKSDGLRPCEQSSDSDSHSCTQTTTRGKHSQDTESAGTSKKSRRSDRDGDKREHKRKKRKEEKHKRHKEKHARKGKHR